MLGPRFLRRDHRPRAACTAAAIDDNRRHTCLTICLQKNRADGGTQDAAELDSER